MSKTKIPIESLVILHNKLLSLSARHPDRTKLHEEVAQSFKVSLSSVRRALKTYQKPSLVKRSDFNCPRNLSFSEMKRYCELIAALKIRTTNKKGRHLSTPRALWILENHGVEVDGEKFIVPKGLLAKSTVNRYLKRQGFSPKGLWIEPVVVHFQAEHSNEFWQVDFTTSELQKLSGEGSKSSDTKLLLASVVDDRSGTSYQEYFLSDGENVLMALQFLFNAMSPKKDKDFPFQGIPKGIYLDNGPISKSLTFLRVMELLGIEVKTHMPRGSDGRRTTARAKGKVERPFRTIQDSFETLYHFHKPQSLEEANEWLWNYLKHYNAMAHRTEDQSRLEDWKQNLPPEGYRKMCSWDRFCQMAREPYERRVGSDARITLEGIPYQLNGEMACETVIVLFGLFDQEIYVEFAGEKKGPFHPAGAPIPLHTYRSFKKTDKEKKLDDLFDLAKRLTVPRSVFGGQKAGEDLEILKESGLFSDEETVPFIPFERGGFVEPAYFKDILEAKLAIASFLGRPLATLHDAQRCHLDNLMTETLHKKDLVNKVKAYFELRLYQAGGQ